MIYFDIELKLFSSDRANKKSKDEKIKKLKTRAGIAGAIIGGGFINSHAGKNVINKLNKDTELTPELLKSAKKSGYKVDKADPNIVAITGSPAYATVDNNTVYVTDKNINSGILAHELGHLDIAKNHKLLNKATQSKLIMAATNPMIPVSLVNAYHSGYKTEMNKLQGKKSSRILKHKAWVVPTALAGIRATREAGASIIGLNKMKKLGASKSQLNSAKKTLGTALGTYLAMSLMNAGTTTAAYKLGQARAREAYKRKIKRKK